MIVNDRYIFVHTPKTGGQSITQALGGRTQRLSLHTPLRCIEKGNRFAFGFVRNPWSRMVSLYRFMSQKTVLKIDDYDQPGMVAMGFKAWVMEEQFFMEQDKSPWPCLTENWTGDGGSELLPMQRRPQLWWLDGCDFIGFYEEMRGGFNIALHEIGLDPRPLPHINATQGGDWRAEYDDESRAFIAKHFAPDIDRFGYMFE